jgi:hypothetical protein
MVCRGDIVVERLTGKRAMVIHVGSADEVTCRFSDGRLEERFTFELDTGSRPLLDSLVSLVTSPFRHNTGEQDQASAAARPAPTPRLARQSRSS